MKTPKVIFASSLLGVALTSTFLATANAQTKIQRVEPPTGVVSSAQPWLTHQEWFCIPQKKYNPNVFAKEMAERIASLGAGGWEPVAFNQVSIAGASCFLATFKVPKQR